MTETDEHTYVVVAASADKPKSNRVKHIGHERDGELVPRCNSHYVSEHDFGPRAVRQATPDEQDFRVCVRCLRWKPWVW